LPQINGLNLLKRIKECTAKLPLIHIADESCDNVAIEALLSKMALLKKVVREDGDKMNFIESLKINVPDLYAKRKKMDIIANNLADIETTRTEKGGPDRWIRS
jgi:DNA-binding NtrC family response regulator